MGYVLTTPATSEPLVLQEARDHLRLGVSDGEQHPDDSYVSGLIMVAREQVEKDTSIQMLPATWELYRDIFPSPEIILEKSPVRDITTIQYYDIFGNLQTIDPQYYELDKNQLISRVRMTNGASWPMTFGKYNAVIITFTAGYDNASAVPPILKACMKLLIGHWYETRQLNMTGVTMNKIPAGYNELIEKINARFQRF